MAFRKKEKQGFCNDCGVLLNGENSLISLYKHTIYCRICSSKRKKSWYSKNPLKAWASACLGSHKQKGYVIQITVTQLIDLFTSKPECSICGKHLEPIRSGTKCDPRNREITPTLDRINNEKIITIDNIQILCNRCNNSKSDRTMDEFIDFCTKVANKFKERK